MQKHFFFEIHNIYYKNIYIYIDMKNIFYLKKKQQKNNLSYFQLFF